MTHRIIAGLHEAIAVARGEDKPARLTCRSKPQLAISQEAAWVGRQLVELLVNGLQFLDHRLPGKPVGQPLTVDQAAIIIGYTRKRVLTILAQPRVAAALAMAKAHKGHGR